MYDKFKYRRSQDKIKIKIINNSYSNIDVSILKA